MASFKNFLMEIPEEKQTFSRYDRVDTLSITYKILGRRQKRIRQFKDTRRYLHGDLKARETYARQSYEMVERWTQKHDEEIIGTLYNGIWNNPIHINK
jgi:hypothetical protein